MVDQLRDYADPRLIAGCVYCGGADETKDHVPSRVFLDPPLPTNLPVVPACRRCNIGLSRDEEYVACLIEAVVTGSTDPDKAERPAIAQILRRTPLLRSRIEASRNAEGSFTAESERVRNVILKLARGHAAFELSTICRKDPETVGWQPLATMTRQQLDNFDASHVTQLFGEVGSRGMQRLCVAQVAVQTRQDGHVDMLNLVVNDWIDVQEGRYRYLAVDERDTITIKIVLHEYLACEVSWRT